MQYFWYNIFFTGAFILSLPVLPFLLLFRKVVRRGIGERFACYSRTALDMIGGSRPIWIHAASVGEVMAAAELSHQLKAQLPARKLIVSTFTETGNKMARKITAADLVFFLPLDQLWIIRRALRKLRPAALIILETEIWPNLLREAYKRGVPTLLLSGRLSVGALKRYTRFRSFFRQVIQCFSLLGMQSEEDARRIASLGADRNRITVVGNLKHAVSNQRATGGGAAENATARIKSEGYKPLLVVGSSHEGEEEILIAVYHSLKKRFPALQMVVAPRHPRRAPEIEKLLHARRLDYEKKSAVNGSFKLTKDIMLLDTLGELQSFYAIADIAFVGGSLVDAGGHNLLEPARFRKPVLFGPYMDNFATLAAEMKRTGGGIEVTGASDLMRTISDLLTDPERRRTVGEKAYQVARDDRGVMQKSLELAQPYLPAA